MSRVGVILMIIFKESKSSTVEAFNQTWANQIHRFEDINRKYKLIHQTMKKQPLEQSDLYHLFDPDKKRHPTIVRQIQNLASNLDLINTYRGKQIDDLGFIDLIPCQQIEWQSILCHLINPTIFPIFNKDIYRSYLYINYTMRDERPLQDAYSSLYIDYYIPFYQSLRIKKEHNSTFHAAMEIFGRFLKSPFGKTLTKTISFSYIDYLLDHSFLSFEEMKQKHSHDFYWKRVDSYHLFSKKDEWLKKHSHLIKEDQLKKEEKAMLQAIQSYYEWDEQQIASIYQLTMFLKNYK
ncbi:MAG TPA: hypothetical protein VK982_09000 [Bacteroidales bacterium]|nr:hypothetical protein [Bacteroidales bacterium]